MDGSESTFMGETNHLRLSPETNVYLLAENRMLRDALARLLRKRSEINVVGVSNNSEMARADIVASQCEVVLTDSFADRAHSGSLHELLGEGPRIKLLLFGMSEDPDVFLNAVSLGICGYLLKDASASEIVAAVRAASRGEATCPPSLCMKLIQHFSKMMRDKPGLADAQADNRKTLTPRQLQLIRLVAEGLTNKEIAANLNLSQCTVKNHIRRVMRQMEAANRYDAVNLIRASGQLSAL